MTNLRRSERRHARRGHVVRARWARPPEARGVGKADARNPAPRKTQNGKKKKKKWKEGACAGQGRFPQISWDSRQRRVRREVWFWRKAQFLTRKQLQTLLRQAGTPCRRPRGSNGRRTRQKRHHAGGTARGGVHAPAAFAQTAFAESPCRWSPSWWSRARSASARTCVCGRHD